MGVSRGIPDYWPLLTAYHGVREALYRTIITDARLAADTRILDAGCGDAFYSQLLADLLGPGARIVALDHNPDLLRARPNLAPSVHLCLSDLAWPGLQRAAFDAVWLCRTMHSAPDPVGRLAALAPLLRPGGRLIVIENDTAHDPILSLPAEFERRLREARVQYEKSRCLDGASPDRYHAARYLAAWLTQVGLQAVAVRTYVSEDVAPLDEPAEVYWRALMAWQGVCLMPFLSPADQAAYRRAFDPASPDYLLSSPGFHCLELTTVAWGIRPDSGPRADARPVAT